MFSGSRKLAPLSVVELNLLRFFSYIVHVLLYKESCLALWKCYFETI